MSSDRNYIMTEIYKRGKKTNIIVGWIIVISLFLAVIHIMMAHGADYYLYGKAGFLAGMFFIPVLLLAGLYGYFVSLFIYLIGFILAIIFNTSNAYSMVIYIAAILSFSICSQNGWFKSIFKTLLGCFITLAAIIVNEYLCFNAIMNKDFKLSTFLTATVVTPGECFSIFGCGLFLYLLFNYAPDSVKWTFPLGLIYVKEYEGYNEFNKKIRGSKFSTKITVSIVVAIITMGIGVSVFMMVLFPDIKEFFIRDYEDNVAESGLLKDIDGDGVEDLFYDEMSRIDYRIDNVMISFNIKMMLLVISVGAPIAGFLNYFIRTYIAGPLIDISDFMDEYAHSKDDDKIAYGHKIDEIHIKSNDEVKTIYNAVRDTVNEMEAYIGRIKMEQKLETDLAIAKRANEAKSSFLSNMSHEIRTPINAVLGMNEMILRESNDDQIIEYANNVKSAGNSLLSLVNDILDFSKIEAGKMEILPVQYNLGSLINDLVNMVSARADEKNLELVVNVDKDMPANLVGDEVRLKQIVTNLLTNAVKYTEKGKVTLAVYFKKIDDENISLHFEVGDSGIGIKEEDLSKLYSPFERIEEIRNRTIEGSGLGMSIVKKLLAMMDTKLEVESVYGLGSIFSFGVKQKVFSWEPVGDFKEKYREYVQSAEQYHESFQAPEVEILVVDDTEMNLTVIKSLLKQTLIKITTASSGKETLEIVTQKRFDLIFLDHRMPEMDGIETFEAMKTLSDNKNKDVPVIALTANAVSGAREEYMRHGFTDYISKPVNGIRLEEMLLHYLPVEKILSVSIKNGEDKYESEFASAIPEDSILKKISNVDLNAGIANCGGIDTYQKVLKDFYISIDSKADTIDGFLADNDLRNYTVLVHALKSSARLIGASELSKMAEQQEALGNEGLIENIKANHDKMIQMYRCYKENLKAIEDSNDNKQEISAEDVNRAFKDIKELVEAYDFDTADSIMEMLNDYAIPSELQEKYSTVKQLMVAVDRDKLIELL